MQIIILAAGQGTRLRPYTINKPKCLVRVARKTILEHQLETFKSCGIEKKDISIVGGYFSDQIIPYGLRVFENKNFKITNMVYSLFCASELFKLDEDLIISYGDIIYETSVLNKLISEESDISIVADLDWEKLWRLRMENPLNDAETFKYNSNYDVVEIGNKAKSLSEINAQYIGLIKIKKSFFKVFERIYEDINLEKNIDANNIYMTSFIEYLIAKGIPVKACLINGGWIEIDSISDLEIYNDLYIKNNLLDYVDFLK